MPTSLWYSDTALGQINEYLSGITDGFIAIAAKEELRREMAKLLNDPRLGTAPLGPAMNRLTHRFTLQAAGRRLAQVSYRISPDGDRLDILLFSSVPA